MISIPQRLIDLDFVELFYNDGENYILKKELPESSLDRKGYISTHVFTMVLEGEQQISTYDGDMTRVRQQELAFLPKGMYNISDLIAGEGTFQSLLFFFGDDLLSEFLGSVKGRHDLPRQQEKTHFKLPYKTGIETFIKAFFAHSGIIKNNRNGLGRIKILELLHLLEALDESGLFLNRLFQAQSGQKRSLKSFMSENFDKPLKIKDYAYLTGRSLSSFRRDFKRLFKDSPNQWIKRKRLEKGVKLLCESSLSVTEVAFEVGYENISYFIKEFKKEYKLTPKQYLLSRKPEPGLD